MFASSMRCPGSHGYEINATSLAIARMQAHAIASLLAIGAIMYASATRLDLAATTPPIGYRRYHPDVSINFQCNRLAQWIGPSAIDEVAELAAHANTYPELI